MNRPVQFFSDEYLALCRKMSSSQIAKFLEDFRSLQVASGSGSKCRMISIKIPEDLLAAFRVRCDLHRKAYQTTIKELMRDWLNKNTNV